MKKQLLFCSALLALGLMASCSGASKSKTAADSVSEDSAAFMGPQLGEAAKGDMLDKSGDAALQAMIKEVVPQFKQLTFTDKETGKTMAYNLFSPEKIEKGKKYPVVMFIADASTPGRDVTAPLTQGYGGIIWASKDSQKKNPCYVLVPQFSGVAVNDAYQHTDEADIAIRLLQSVIADNQIDSNKVYSTGQSMGGMLSMYYDVAYPDLFAASIFVDSHWDKASFNQLVKHKFVYFVAGDEGKSYPCIQAIEDACREEGVGYAFSSWSAQLPEKEQSDQAKVMLDKGNPVNIFEFEPKTVLPADGKGSEHMLSFDKAYQISSVRDWLFKQSLK